MASVDFVISNEGTIISFQPVSQAAKDWVAENVHLESWQWLGDTFNVDHRYAGDLIEGIQAADFDMWLS